MNKIEIERAKTWIKEADYVLFTAGAGLTAAAGINYADKALFAREFPAMLQYGFSAQYEFIGFDNWTPDLQWGYWASHVNLVRFQWPEAEVYRALHQLVQHIDAENTFVMTSNVDAMFERNGFDSERIYTPQGDYALLQCTTPCSRAVWPWREQIDQIIAATDPTTQRLTDLDLVPRCPNCGGVVFPNVRVDSSFVSDHFASSATRLQKWLTQAQQAKGVVIEVGAGFNTPSVIRWPGEQIVEENPDWRLIRINLTDADIPKQISDRAIGFEGDAVSIVSAL
ncbi:Sir2 family NAD-dependent protein deacetylase [Photobacterium iliopiscarium]|jgi:NAD-dependent SIR2 family protein deacetylase|uniref:NAD-dependent protein deacetylase of SIR2 family n=1 Tax=Photobacterium iliopiscarium TaxID=56192 RepID=A0A2T3M9D8_9GAMM|nr:Sir2 family NAD-dependent protein deacetylase [Photobacterium iliopiscarium]PSV89372.1 NAD-dependent protein deacetylase of SIR2 family [Photobacterium iliopiscarium]